MDVQFEDAAVGRPDDARRDVYVGQLEQRAHRRQPVGVVVVACDYHHVLNRTGKIQQSPIDDVIPPPRTV